MYYWLFLVVDRRQWIFKWFLFLDFGCYLISCNLLIWVCTLERQVRFLSTVSEFFWFICINLWLRTHFILLNYLLFSVLSLTPYLKWKVMYPPFPRYFMVFYCSILLSQQTKSPLTLSCWICWSCHWWKWVLKSHTLLQYVLVSESYGPEPSFVRISRTQVFDDWRIFGSYSHQTRFMKVSNLIILLMQKMAVGLLWKHCSSWSCGPWFFHVLTSGM